MLLETTLLNVDNASSNSFATPDIVLEWHDWNELESIVNSIWGGSKFCRTLDDNIDHYYRQVRARQLPVEQQLQPTRTDEQLRSKPPLPIPNISLLYEISCNDLYKLSRHGTGNYIQAIYFMRMVVKFMPNVNIKLNITCIENRLPDYYTNYVLPWFTGVWYTPTATERMRQITDIQQYNPFISNMEYGRYCGHYQLNPTAVLYKEMLYDVRRMVIALVGTKPFINDSDNDRQSRKEISVEIEKFLDDNIYLSGKAVGRYVSLQQRYNISLKPGLAIERINSKTTNIIPLVQMQQPRKNIRFDEAVIHFRCGDLLTVDLSGYGFLTFHGYSRHISSSVRSIGILTQPFGKLKKNAVVEKAHHPSSIADQGRTMDTANEIVARRCLTLVYAFKQYLEDKFPNATVQIHNDRTESIALAYARMVLAKQVVGSMSTFSIYPIIGTFGTGYYLRPKEIDPSCWLQNDMYPVSKIQELRTVIFDDNNTLLGRDPRELWNSRGDDFILQWFRNEDGT